MVTMRNNRISQDAEQTRFFEEQLFEAQRALFAANSVREAKFLQSKIKFLKEKMKNTKK